MPAPAIESLPAIVSAVRMRFTKSRLFSEDQKVLIRKKRLLVDQFQTGRGRLRDDDARRHALDGVGSWSAISFAVVDDADAPLRLERTRDVLQHQHRVFHFVKRIDDENGVSMCACR